jgi:hypothetical protein
VKATQDWDWAGAERAFQRAISLNPRYPTADAALDADRAHASAGLTTP